MSKQTQSQVQSHVEIKSRKNVYGIIFLGEEKKSFIILNNYLWLFLFFFPTLSHLLYFNYTSLQNSYDSLYIMVCIFYLSLLSQYYTILCTM